MTFVFVSKFDVLELKKKCSSSRGWTVCERAAVYWEASFSVKLQRAASLHFLPKVQSYDKMIWTELSRGRRSC